MRFRCYVVLQCSFWLSDELDSFFLSFSASAAGLLLSHGRIFQAEERWTKRCVVSLPEKVIAASTTHDQV